MMSLYHHSSHLPQSCCSPLQPCSCPHGPGVWTLGSKARRVERSGVRGQVSGLRGRIAKRYVNSSEK
uniref:Uncharacterized protein n=1 Tax=Knipowitschia caucasica TaxID=637954 RepID=A0AAV2KT85_KNICA